MSLCRKFARIVIVFLWRTTFGGYRRNTEITERRSAAVGGVRYVEAKHEWGDPNRILVVQLGTERARGATKVSENLINALKLLTNQQTDGDSPTQSLVTGLQERSRKGIMDGLRSFIEIDNHSTLDVGHLRKGSKLFFFCPEAEIQ